MKEEERCYYHWFVFRSGISERKKRDFLLIGKNPEQIYHFSNAECRHFFQEKELLSFQKCRNMEATKRDVDWMFRHHVWTVFWNEERYPRKLKQIFQYPLGLCVKGNSRKIIS